MATRVDKSKLRKAKAEVGGATELEAVAAVILLSVNDIDNALEYVRNLPRLRRGNHQLQLPGMENIK